jgi:hypothetical protein
MTFILSNTKARMKNCDAMATLPRKTGSTFNVFVIR